MKTNHLDIVKAVYENQPAVKSSEGALRFTLAVLAALPPEEKAGLLIKNSGENVENWNGHNVSNSRVCYPDGQLYKILTDVPSTNGPQWLDNGSVDPWMYVDVTGEITIGGGGIHEHEPPSSVVSTTVGRAEKMLFLEWLHEYYQKEAGLQRVLGLWIGDHPDFEGIAVWTDVYETQRHDGKTVEEAKAIVVAVIEQSAEWKIKHGQAV